MALKFLLIFGLFFLISFAVGYHHNSHGRHGFNTQYSYIANNKMIEYFSWKQIGYDFNGIRYTQDSDYRKNSGPVIFQQQLNDSEKYFIQYNNLPMGIAVYEKTNDVYITLPRRKHGIPSTVNTVSSHRYGHSHHSPLLAPVPSPSRLEELVSVYRPTVDHCDRLWLIDTGLLEAPDAVKQVQPPSISIYDLKTRDTRRILKYELKPTDLLNERTSGGLALITVEVDPNSCENAYGYINDWATETLIVFSLKELDSWSFSHPSFKLDPSALNFTVSGRVVRWRDGIFSTALGDANAAGRRKLYFHPMASTKEFSVYTDQLKKKGNTDLQVILEGERGPNTQSGSHAYHSGTRTLFFAAFAKDAILCWNVDKPLIPENVGIAAQDHQKLIYISDLKIVQDEVWVMVNQMPQYLYSTFDLNEYNYFVHRGNVRALIQGTPCEV